MIINDIDAWDRREFLNQMEINNNLKDTDIEGNKKKSDFTEFMLNIFSGLYKYNPTTRNDDEIIKGSEWMMDLYKEITSVPEWNILRERTKLNADSAAEAAAEFCMNIVDKLDDENKRLDMSDPQNASLFRNTAREAIKASTEKVDEYNNMMSAFAQGTEDGYRKTIALNKKRELMKRLSDNKILKRIANLAGRFCRIADAKQKTKTRHGVDEISNITIGNDIARLIPSETMKLSHRILKTQFKKNYLEKNLMQYELRGKEKQGKGPIVVCIDESGTMEGDKDVWAKAVSMAILSVAQKQNRDFFMIHYDSHVTRTDCFNRKSDPINIADAMTHFTGGGTSFEKPLNQAIQVIKDSSNFKKADIIFITDGIANVSDEFLKLFNKAKKISETSVISVLIDMTNKDGVKDFSDKIIAVDINNDQEALDTVFSI